MSNRVRTAIDVVLPGGEASPQRKIAVRLLVALVLITFVAVITYAGRDGYTDPEDDSISVLDAFYYSTVSITTTGYGDVRPVTDEARFVTTVLVTPARILFLVLLVGTTLEILAERSRQAFRVARWRRRLHDHTIICGYGTKGRSALKTLVGKGLPKERIVAIDPSDAAQAHAQGDGVAVIASDATSQEALHEAGIAEARSVIVAVERDDTAILVTLTARELNPTATIVAAAREEENVHLLHQGGADGVITSSSAAGRLLGLSSETPQVTEVLEDILTLGKGLDIVEREVGPGEGVVHTHHTHQTALLAIVRGDELIRFGDPRAAEILPGDKVVELRNAVVEEDAASAAGGDAGR